MIRTVAFFSYTRADDESSANLLSKIREQLESRIGMHYGHSVEVFQDVDDIKVGDDWREKLKKALQDATYFVPIITPRFFNSKACRDELAEFIEKAINFERNDIIIPILFVRPSILTQEEERSWDHLEASIERVQWADWSKHSVKTKITPSLRNDIDELARHIAEKLRRDDIQSANKEDEDSDVSKAREKESLKPKRQSFSHGRTKNVVVETKRKRVVVPKPGASVRPGSVTGSDTKSRPAGISDAELERRMKALAAAKAREADEAELRKAEERTRAEERERRQAESKSQDDERNHSNAQPDFLVDGEGNAALDAFAPRSPPKPKTSGIDKAPDRSRREKTSFSHGRTKNVVVETKRKRVVVPKPGASVRPGSVTGSDTKSRPASISDAELERRMKALAAAKAREADEAELRKAKERARAEERERRRAEADRKGN